MKTETVDNVGEKAKAIVNDLSQRGWANNLDLELAMANCLSRAIDEALLEEREACAKIAEGHNAAGEPIAQKIRARSQNSNQSYPGPKERLSGGGIE